MGQCFLYGSGGGARSYKVTGSVSAPKNPFHGDIWVQTSVAVTDTYITAEQVVIPGWDGHDGMILIVTGTQWSEDLFVDSDHRQEYTLYLFPRSCVQWFDGAWHRMNAYIYHTFKNRWIQFSSAWDGTLFYNGNQYADVTGGWAGADSYSPNLSATLMSGTITISTVSAVDLSGFSTLKFIGSGNGSQSGEYYPAKCKIFNESGGEVASLDFQNNNTYAMSVAALSGKHYVRFTVSGSRGNNLNISKVWLE